jgi:hypothetical protein
VPVILHIFDYKDHQIVEQDRTDVFQFLLDLQRFGEAGNLRILVVVLFLEFFGAGVGFLEVDVEVSDMRLVEIADYGVSYLCTKGWPELMVFGQFYFNCALLLDVDRRTRSYWLEFDVVRR